MKGIDFYIACPNKTCAGQFRRKEIKFFQKNAEYNSKLTTIITDRLNKDIHEIFDDKEINEILRADSKLNSGKKVSPEKGQIEPIYATSNKKEIGDGEYQEEFRQNFNNLETSPIVYLLENVENPSSISMKKHMSHMNFDNVENVNTQTFYGQVNHLEKNTYMPNNVHNFGASLKKIDYNNIQMKEEVKQKPSMSFKPANQNNSNYSNQLTKYSNNDKLRNSSNKINCVFCYKETEFGENGSLIRCRSMFCKGRKLFCRICRSKLSEEESKSHFPQSFFSSRCINSNYLIY